MALIVETGTGVANANSYGTFAEASAYFTLLGNLDWTDDQELGNAALINASQAVDLEFGAAYMGDRLTATQGLLFPRTAFVARDGFERTGVPVELKRAVFEMALLHFAGEQLVADPNPDANLSRITQKVGDLELTKEFLAGSSTSKLTKARLQLLPILKLGRTKGSIRVVRG